MKINFFYFSKQSIKFLWNNCGKSFGAFKELQTDLFGKFEIFEELFEKNHNLKIIKILMIINLSIHLSLFSKSESEFLIISISEWLLGLNQSKVIDFQFEKMYYYSEIADCKA